MFYHHCLDVKLPRLLPKDTVKLRKILPKVTHTAIRRRLPKDTVKLRRILPKVAYNATDIPQTVIAEEFSKKLFAEMLNSRINKRKKDNSHFIKQKLCNTQTNNLEKVPTTMHMTNSKQAVCNTSIKISKETDTNVQVSRIPNVGNSHVSITCSQTNDNSEKMIKQSGNESETDFNFSNKVNSKEINENSIEKAGSELRLVGSVPVESSAFSKGW